MFQNGEGEPFTKKSKNDLSFLARILRVPNIFFGETGIITFWSQELANFCERGSGIDQTGIWELVVGKRSFAPPPP